MKKTILTAVIISSLATSAFAKTQGNQIGVDVLRASADHRYKQGSVTASNYKKFDDSSYGIGANYKYALNFNGVFVAPGMFYENFKTEAKDKDNDTISLKNRYGAKVDIGYDITDNIAAYASAGYASFDYTVNWKSVSQKKSGRASGMTYGAGLAFSATKNLILGLEYNIQSADLKTPNLGGINKAATNLSVVKLGVAYRF